MGQVVINGDNTRIVVKLRPFPLLVLGLFENRVATHCLIKLLCPSNIVAWGPRFQTHLCHDQNAGFLDSNDEIDDHTTLFIFWHGRYADNNVIKSQDIVTSYPQQILRLRGTVIPPSFGNAFNWWIGSDGSITWPPSWPWHNGRSLHKDGIFFGFWGLLYHVISHSHRLLGTWPSLLFAECWGVAPSPPFSETPIFDADIRVIPSGKPIKLPGFWIWPIP